MSRTPDEIEESLDLPDAVVAPALAKIADQDEARGDWPSPRESQIPDAPWPPDRDPMLWFLICKAEASLEAGMDVRSALVQLASHSWFEGGIENYDRGMRDGRRPRAV